MLARSYSLLTKEKKLTVGFFGGSITWGSNASDPEKTSYRALTTAWLRGAFPEAKIESVNAAIGGTGSDFGAFRVGYHLLPSKPDLVFLEYAVNDSGASVGLIRAGMEGIIRQVRRQNPVVEIVVLLTLNGRYADEYARGWMPAVVYAHTEIARHYGLPVVNLGRPLAEALLGAGKPLTEALPDSVHPNDTGFSNYAATLRSWLERWLKEGEVAPVAPLPEPLGRPYETAGLVDCTKAAGAGFALVEKSLCNVYPHYVEGQPGAWLEFAFEGTAVGVFWMMASDSGDVAWSIDGGEPVRASSWDKYCEYFDRAHYKIFRDDLKPGRHVLRVGVLDEKAEGSKGKVVRIAAFLVM